MDSESENRTQMFTELQRIYAGSKWDKLYTKNALNFYRFNLSVSVPGVLITKKVGMKHAEIDMSKLCVKMFENGKMIYSFGMENKYFNHGTAFAIYNHLYT